MSTSDDQVPAVVGSYDGRMEHGSSQYAYELGHYIRKNSKNILLGLFVLFVVAMLFTILSMEIEQSEMVHDHEPLSYLNIAYHWRCKGTGCGANCPYSDPTDPNVFISDQTQSLKQLLTIMLDTFDNEVARVTRDAGKFTALAGVLQQHLTTEGTCVDNVYKIVNAAKSIDKAYSSNSVSSTTYTAQQYLVALMNLANINKNAMLIHALVSSTEVTSTLLESEHNNNNSNIENIDKHYNKWADSVGYIRNNATVLDNQILSTGSKFGVLQNLVLTSINSGTFTLAPGSQYTQIMDVVVQLAQINDQVKSILHTIRSNHKVLQSFEHAYENEAFTERMNTDMPGAQVTADAKNQLIRTGDYDSLLKTTSLEPSIFEAHRKFSGARSKFDSSVSTYSIRDDPNDVVPWRPSLYGRPTYTKSDGVTPADVSSTPLSSIPSDNTANMIERGVRINFSG
jgi:hypothetical protein